MKHIVGILCHRLGVLTFVGITLVCGGGVQAQTSSRVYYYHGQSDQRADVQPGSRTGREATLVHALRETDRDFASNGIMVSRGGANKHGSVSSGYQAIVRRAATNNPVLNDLHCRNRQPATLGLARMPWLFSVEKSTAEKTAAVPRIVLSTGMHSTEPSIAQSSNAAGHPAPGTDRRDADSSNTESANAASNRDTEHNIDARYAGLEGNAHESGTGEVTGAVNRDADVAHGISHAYSMSDERRDDDREGRRSDRAQRASFTMPSPQNTIVLSHVPLTTGSEASLATIKIGSLDLTPWKDVVLFAAGCAFASLVIMIPCLMILRPLARYATNRLQVDAATLKVAASVSAEGAAAKSSGGDGVAAMQMNVPRMQVSAESKRARLAREQAERERAMLRAIFEDNMKLRDKWKQLPLE